MDKFLEKIEKNIKGISEDFASGNVDKYFFIAGNWQEAEALRKRYGVAAYADLMAKHGEVKLCMNINVNEGQE